MWIRFAVVAFAAMVFGYWLGQCSLPKVAGITHGLDEQPVIVDRLLEVRFEPIRIGEGCVVAQEPYLVDDFLARYIAFLNDPETSANANQMVCGVISDKICDLTYVDGAGGNQHLRFELDAESGQVKPESLECIGEAG